MILVVNAIARTLGEEQAQALPVFHALSGCDTASAFGGEKDAWEAWNCYQEVTEAFSTIKLELKKDSNTFRRLEHYTIVLHSKTNNQE